MSSITRPSAILCNDDETAIEVLHFAKHNGLKIPNDLSVMGLHNIRMSEITDPPLTSLEQPMKNIGQTAMQILSERINQIEVSFNVQNTFHHQIIIRQSTSRPSN
jgi:LacI family repressor for deo operon, udp, cdd, tsx, nupC, and nupG